MLRFLRSRNRPFFGTVRSRIFCSNAPASNVNDAAGPPSASPTAANHDLSSTTHTTPRTKSYSSTFFKIGIFGMLTAATAAASYITYAYAPEELDEKTKTFRSSINYSVEDDSSALEKLWAFLYSSSMTVTAKAIEFYLDLRRPIEEQDRGLTEPSAEKLLPDLHPMEQHVFTLVLDLNETLVYSNWNSDRGWKTFKRPGVEDFLEHLAPFYEIVVYSDLPLNMYVDPVIERLDGKGLIRYRLARNATKYQDGKFYRDLSRLNRDPSRIVYVSGHAVESSLQPENCIPVKAWKLEGDDTALLDLIPFLEYVARNRPSDIRQVLASYKGVDIATEFIQRSKEYQRQMPDQKSSGVFWWR